MNPEIKRLSSIADNMGAKLLPIMRTQNLTKKDVYVVVDTPKKAKKLKRLLDMFGEKTFSINSIDVGYDLAYDESDESWYNKSIDYRKELWYDEVQRKEVSIKQLRSILAKEHLKAGDYVICSGFYDSSIVKIKSVSEDRINVDKDLFFGTRNLHTGGFEHISTFKRYATPEEIALLEPKKVDKFAQLKEAYKNGAVIQYRNRSGVWVDCAPVWSKCLEYRIKPEEKPKVGDVVKAWYNDSPNEFIIKIADVEDLTIFPNIKVITKQEAIDLLFRKEAFNA